MRPQKGGAIGGIDALCWGESQLGEAMRALARESGFRLKHPELFPGGAEKDEEALDAWIEATAGRLGLEAEPVAAPYAEAETMIRKGGPALLCLPGGRRFLAITRAGRRFVFVLTPQLRMVRISPSAVREELCSKMEAPLKAEVDELLAEAQVPPRQQAKAREAILRDRLAACEVGSCWLLRAAPGAGFWEQAKQVDLPKGTLALLLAHAAEYLLWALSWWMVGNWALQGRLDKGWLLAWVLTLVTLVPFRLAGTWLEGSLALRAGALFKRRLLYGALRLEPEEVRRQGVGQTLGRVIESQAVESLALTGGLQGLLAGIEFLVAAVVLALGGGGTLQMLVLGGWIAVTLWIGWGYVHRRREWTKARLGLTDDLVEGMVGYRTRLAQQSPVRWHEGEDEALDRYLELSGKMDRTSVRLSALVPRGWILLGLLGLAPAFLSSTSPVSLAISLGGILLAYRAFRRLTISVSSLVGAGIAWDQVAELFRAAGRPEMVGTQTLSRRPEKGRRESPGDDQGETLIEAHELVFRYPDRGEPVLRKCDLTISVGDRALLEGPSGGGKSTLASLLVGLRHPQSGLLLLRGLDRQTLGSRAWRQRVVAAPQFHENHVLTETFAFNLLMGRGWPPSRQDLEQAEAVCKELGLGELLARMPAGLLQMVGDTGWQLSHGERSRLYIARALLQGADLVVLDESFAALDPENLRRSLGCVLRRAPTLLVIAHP
jgi:ATP-binding cassette, subfamily B, bacterial